MDFLDPRKKRSHKIRLITGYILTSVAIGLSTLILVYGANGYGINTKTGEIVENSLLFVDSKPGGAEIFLNDKDQNSNTSARLILPSGKYKLTLKKQGYDNWQRDILLEEHNLKRYVYPFLYPTKPTVDDKKPYTSLPGFTSQSPDRKWLLVQSVSAPVTNSVVLDEFDTSDLSKPAQQISLPNSLFTNLPPGTLKEVEWSSDNDHLLIQNINSDRIDYLLISRAEPNKSVNLSNQFKLGSDVELALKNKKTDKLYLLNKTNHTLQLISPKDLSSDPPILKNVLAFKVNDENLLTYVTPKNNQAEVRIWDNAKSYRLTDIPLSNKYLLDAAKYKDFWFYVVASDSLSHSLIYKDPISQVRNPKLAKAIPYRILNSPGVSQIHFSDNARFIEAQAGPDFDVYDFENDELFGYTLDPLLNLPMKWMDGHRLIGNVNGELTITDYDSTNTHKFGKTSIETAAYFDNAFNHMLTFVVQPDGSAVLRIIDMRAAADLPANHISN